MLRTHGVHYLLSFVLLEEVGILRLSNYSWTLELDCFVSHAWFALPVCSRDGIFLLEAGGILSLSNYSWTVGLQIVSLGTHGLYYLFPFVGKLLLEAVGILSLSNYC